MTGATLCSGIMAPEVSAPYIGWKWTAEVDPFCCDVIRHYTSTPNLGDITAVDLIDRAKELGPIDVLVAGTPCQAFSVAGLRGSLNDARGNLTLTFVRIVHELKPKCAVWENVPGVYRTHDDAFGCLLAGLVGSDAPIHQEQGWAHAGVVTGPLGSLAYRTLDAQYWAVPQRRERVFLVWCPRNGPDPGDILFEWESLRRDYPPSREAGEGTAYDTTPSITGSGPATSRAGDSRGQDPVIAMSLNAKGGSGRSDGESETFVASTLKANSGRNQVEQQYITAALDASYGRLQGCSGQDANHGHSHLVAAPLTGKPYADREARESQLITHSLRADGFDASEDGTGRGVPLVAETVRSHPRPGSATHGLCIPILEAGARTGSSTTDPRAGMGIGEPGDPMFTLQSGKQHAVAFDTTQITSRANGSNPQPGDLCHPLASGAHPPAVAFQESQSGVREYDTAGCVRANGPGNDPVGTRIRNGMAVRRLTVVECCRLQAFPDHWLHHVIRLNKKGQPKSRVIAADMAAYLQGHGIPCWQAKGRWRTNAPADGPMYKAISNSKCVNVIGWILQRVAKALNA